MKFKVIEDVLAYQSNEPMLFLLYDRTSVMFGMFKNGKV